MAYAISSSVPPVIHFSSFQFDCFALAMYLSCTRAGHCTSTTYIHFMATQLTDIIIITGSVHLLLLSFGSAIEAYWPSSAQMQTMYLFLPL